VQPRCAVLRPMLTDRYLRQKDMHRTRPGGVKRPGCAHPTGQAGGYALMGGKAWRGVAGVVRVLVGGEGIKEVSSISPRLLSWPGGNATRMDRTWDRTGRRS
jgi:hypothetical protein